MLTTMPSPLPSPPSLTPPEPHVGSPRLRGPALVALCLLLTVGMGCTRTTPLATGESPASAERSARDPGDPSGDTDGDTPDDAAGDTDPAGDPAGTPDDADPQHGATGVAPADSGSQAAADTAQAPPEPLPPVDMTPAAAPGLCANLVDDPDLVRSCAFLRGGVTLPEGARADVLEFLVDDPSYGEVRRAYLVVRTPAADYTTTQELGEGYDIPGSSVGYRLGRLQRTAQGVRIQVTLSDETFAYTGDPDHRGPRDVETVRYVYVCTRQDEGFYDCGRD